jgi:hypothetical protein
MVAGFEVSTDGRFWVFTEAPAEGHVPGQGAAPRPATRQLGGHPGAGVRGSRRVIAVDTNLLVYAHREDAVLHEPALAWLTHVAEGPAQGAMPWPCVHEFLAIVTHPRIYQRPMPRGRAVDQVEAWLESPRLVLLGEGEGYFLAGLAGTAPRIMVILSDGEVGRGKHGRECG